MPDLVGLTDIADIAGVSRQDIRKLMLNHSGTFPLAVHEGSPSVWQLEPVLEWLGGRGYELQPRLLETAQTARQVNLTKAVASSVR